MAEEELIQILWHVDRTCEPAEYTLFSVNPKYPDLQVRISSEVVSERVAKARLMEQMYQLGKEKGIQARRLRFKINGVEDA